MACSVHFHPVPCCVLFDGYPRMICSHFSVEFPYVFPDLQCVHIFLCESFRSTFIFLVEAIHVLLV